MPRAPRHLTADEIPAALNVPREAPDKRWASRGRGGCSLEYLDADGVLVMTASAPSSNAGARSVSRRALMASCFVISLLTVGCFPDLPMPEGADSLDREIVRLLEDERVPGASVALVRDGEVVVERAYGYADPDSERMNTTDTRFLVASVSKLITGVAMMQLVEAGMVGLDEPINTLLPFDVGHPQGGAPITLRHLLTHTAGLRDNWSVLEPLYTTGDGDLPLDTFLRDYLIPGGDLYSEGKNFTSRGPGEGFVYSNVGFALVARIVEELEGQDFITYCQAAIFGPLGMNRTSWRLEGIPEEEFAVPTTWRRGFETHAHYGFPDYPSGSLRSTAHDLAIFAQAMLEPSGVPLAPATVAMMWGVAFPEIESSQGLAFYRWRLRGSDLIGHDGGELGASAEIAIRPAEGDLAVVLVNGDMDPEGISYIERKLFAHP